MYLVKQKHPLALRYSNMGVLEKHSWYMASTLLELPEYDPLPHMPPHRREGTRLSVSHPFAVSYAHRPLGFVPCG